MKRTLLIIPATLAACLACGTVLAQTTGNALPQEPGYHHYLAQLAAFDRKFSRLDTDHNGYVDRNEAKAEPALAKDFSRVATNNRVTRPAYTHWKQGQSTGTAAGTAK